MNNYRKILNQDQKLACITLDFELDYGDRVNEFNILEEDQSILQLSKLFSDLNTPVSTFIRTDTLLDYPKSIEIIKLLSNDYHCHSHSHNTQNFDSKTEISTCASTFQTVFDYQPLGYRAPQGVLNNGDIKLIKKYGFKFSSSIFPSYRPGKYNNLSMPIDPFVYENGIMELPFAVIEKLRYTISLSYLKLIGFNLNKALFSTFGLPNIIIFDTHLHDFIVSERSFNKLNWKLRVGWGIRKNYGFDYFKMFIDYLKGRNYSFITMTDLFNYLVNK